MFSSKSDFDAPPPYECLDSSNQTTININEHDEHSKLPTYEEVEIEKSLNINSDDISSFVGQIPSPQLEIGSSRLSQQSLTFLAVETNDSIQRSPNDNSILGTDAMFIAAFTITFIFNWIGFLILTCFFSSVASRYGALSGFGLSLAKWTFIVKHSTEFASHENSWLWWLIMTFGFLICIRALVQYISIKKTWRLLSVSAQERLLFFY